MSSKGTCKAEQCQQAVKAKGYCERHYGQWRKGKLAKPRYKSCHAEGCRKAQVRRGYCPEHFAKEYPGKTRAQAAPESGAAS